MKPFTRKVHGLLLGVLWTAIASAQESSTGPPPKEVPPLNTAIPLNVAQVLDAASQPLSLVDLVQLSLTQNPVLSQSSFDIEAARGRADQAGRYPNPNVSISGEEIGRRAGIFTLPLVTQEIVTANKLGLSRAVASSDVDQAVYSLQARRIVLITAVSQSYFDVLASKHRNEYLALRLEEWNLKYKKFEDEKVKKAVGAVGFLPFRLESNRLEIEKSIAAHEYAAALAKLSATVGAPRLLIRPAFEFSGDDLPNYPFDVNDPATASILDEWKIRIMSSHPEIRRSQAGILKAQLTVAREVAHKYPNVTVGAGYQRNFNERENQAMFQIGMPFPIFNRNQGGIQAAQAELGRAALDVRRVENELSGLLASSFGQYSIARQKAEQLKKFTEDAQSLATAMIAVWQSPNSDLNALNVAQSQRAVFDLRLEYLRSWGDAWRAASELSGLLMEENLPTPAISKR